MFSLLCSLIRLLVPSGHVREAALENLALRQQLKVQAAPPATPIRKGRSSFLASALQGLEGLAACVDHRETREWLHSAGMRSPHDRAGREAPAADFAQLF